MRPSFTLIQLLIVITLVAVLILWLPSPVAKVRPAGETRAAGAIVAWKLVMLAWLPPMVLAKLCRLPVPGSWRYPVPGRRLYSFKMECRNLQAQVKELGTFWWLVAGIAIVGVVCMPAP